MSNLNADVVSTAKIRMTMAISFGMGFFTIGLQLLYCKQYCHHYSNHYSSVSIIFPFRAIELHTYCNTGRYYYILLMGTRYT